VTTEKHKIAVVMPLYNKAIEVIRAIDSVLKQTVSDFELIVVNDGSTDKGPEIVKSINDSRIRIIDQKNAGVSVARNRGICEAQSDLIAFLDADDEWKVSFLETILNLKEKFPACNVFATNYLYREVNGAFRLPIIRGLPSHPWEGILDDYFAVAIKSDPPIWTSAVAVIKGAIRSVGMFPVGVTSGEDLLTWAKLAVYNDIAYSTKPESVFWLRAPRTGMPTRLPDEDDPVGRTLESLLTTVSSDDKKAFKQYIDLWHRMRASMYLRLGMRKEASLEVRNMSRFAYKDIKFYTYSVIVHLPSSISNVLMKCLNFVKSFRL
jgi:glycosyltransferase involved in cell wall biosynthesis